MRRVGLGLALLVLVSPQWLRCEEDEYPPEPVGTSMVEREGVQVHEAILPGSLVDWSTVGDQQGHLTILILTEVGQVEDSDEPGERQVWSWTLDGDGELREVGQSLPAETSNVIGLVPVTGDEAVFLAAVQGRLLGVDDDGKWSERFSSDYELFPVPDVRGGRSGSRGRLILRSIGSLQAVELESASDQLQAVWSFDMPLTADREGGGLRLVTPPVAFLRYREPDTLQLILGPDARGMRRIRSTLVTVEPAGEPEPEETWNMLSNLERVEESWYVEYRGAPALIVTTVLADKHGVFERKKLRLFSLTADRTRAGSRPLLEVMTRSRNWYRTCAGVADVNGDGVDDLVSAQPKGLGAGSLWVEAHLTKSGGGFDAKPRGSEIQVEEGEICSLAVDLTRDGVVDLVVVEGDDLLVFPLISAPEAKTVVDSEPGFRIPFDDISSRPRPISAGRDSTVGIGIAGQTKGRMQAVRVVRFP